MPHRLGDADPSPQNRTAQRSLCSRAVFSLRRVQKPKRPPPTAGERLLAIDHLVESVIASLVPDREDFIDYTRFGPFLVEEDDLEAGDLDEYHWSPALVIAKTIRRLLSIPETLRPHREVVPLPRYLCALACTNRTFRQAIWRIQLETVRVEEIGFVSLWKLGHERLGLICTLEFFMSSPLRGLQVITPRSAIRTYSLLTGLRELYLPQDFLDIELRLPRGCFPHLEHVDMAMNIRFHRQMLSYCPSLISARINCHESNLTSGKFLSHPPTRSTVPVPYSSVRQWRGFTTAPRAMVAKSATALRRLAGTGFELDEDGGPLPPNRAVRYLTMSSCSSESCDPSCDLDLCPDLDILQVDYRLTISLERVVSLLSGYECCADGEKHCIQQAIDHLCPDATVVFHRTRPYPGYSVAGSDMSDPDQIIHDLTLRDMVIDPHAYEDMPACKVVAELAESKFHPVIPAGRNGKLPTIIFLDEHRHWVVERDEPGYQSILAQMCIVSTARYCPLKGSDRERTERDERIKASGGKTGLVGGGDGVWQIERRLYSYRKESEKVVEYKDLRDVFRYQDLVPERAIRDGAST